MKEYIQVSEIPTKTVQTEAKTELPSSPHQTGKSFFRKCIDFFKNCILKIMSFFSSQEKNNTKTSAHERLEVKIEEKKYHIKKNKHGKQKASLYECIFSKVAKLFMANYTPNMLIVKHTEGTNQGKIFGVASEDVENILENPVDFSQEPQTNHDVSSPGITAVNEPDQPNAPVSQIKACLNKLPNKEKKYFFLSEVNESFYNLLDNSLDLKNEISVNMDSLASVLATAYFLEEDDLHKDNIGFYLKEIDQSYEIVFFKIDHDLMFLDSIMSYQKWAARLEKRSLARNFFKIDYIDLDNFPDISKALPHFWVTKRRYVKSALPKTHQKAYNDTEIQFFKKLKDQNKFQKAKWQHLLKCAYMPTEHIQSSIENSVPDVDGESNKLKKAEEIAKVRTMQAVLQRQQLLKIQLLSSNQFKNFWRELDNQEKNNLIQDILKSDNPDESSINQITKEINDTLNYVDACEKQDLSQLKPSSLFSKRFSIRMIDGFTGIFKNTSHFLFNWYKKENNRIPYRVALKLGLIRSYALQNELKSTTTHEINTTQEHSVEAYLQYFYSHPNKVFDLELLRNAVGHQDYSADFLYAILIYYGHHDEARKAVKAIIKEKSELKRELISKLTHSHTEAVTSADYFHKAIEAIAKNFILDAITCQTLIIALFDLADLNSDEMKNIINESDNPSKTNLAYKLIHQEYDSNYFIRTVFGTNRRNYIDYFKTDARKAMQVIYKSKIEEERAEKKVREKHSHPLAIHSVIPDEAMTINTAPESDTEKKEENIQPEPEPKPEPESASEIQQTMTTNRQANNIASLPIQTIDNIASPSSPTFFQTPPEPPLINFKKIQTLFHQKFPTITCKQSNQNEIALTEQNKPHGTITHDQPVSSVTLSPITKATAHLAILQLLAQHIDQKENLLDGNDIEAPTIHGKSFQIKLSPYDESLDPDSLAILKEAAKAFHCELQIPCEAPSIDLL